MICLKRNILIVLMISVNFMSFNRGMAPTNKGFEECYTQFQSAFFIYGKEDFIAPGSLPQFVMSAILYLSEHDNLDYKIIEPKTFCAEVTDEHSELSVQVKIVNFWYKIFEAGTSKEKDEQIENCLRELAVFGSSNDEILESAIRRYRISFVKEKLDHVFNVGNFGFLYMIYISEVVTLKDDSTLITPWEYCRNRHPDKEQKTPKPEDQASSSKQDIK